MPSKRAADRLSLGTHDIARAPAQPALSSCGFTPVRPAHPVRAKDDGDGQVSWLAGQRRSTAFSGPGSQWHVADGSPRTVAGAAGVFPFPLSPRRRGTCRLPRPIALFGRRGQSSSGARFPSPPRRRGPLATLSERRGRNLHHPTPVRAELVEAPSFFCGAKRKNGPSTSSGRTDHIKRTML